MKKVVVLLSGGLDSTVLLAQVERSRMYNEIYALSLDYGQLHKRELECAQWQANEYKAIWVYRDIKDIYFGLKNPLLGSEPMPVGPYEEQLKKTEGRPVPTYVPFRNGLLLSIATATAMRLEARIVCYAAHADDAAGNAYPDCSISFVDAMGSAIREGTDGQVLLDAPFVRNEMTKTDVIRVGVSLGVDFKHTWSCYSGMDVPCGVCGTCIDRERAFKNNGIEDPLNLRK